MAARDAIAPATCVAVLTAFLVAAPAPPAVSGPQMVVAASLSGGQPDARRRPRLRVVPPGPASPTSPTIDRYYNRLQRAKCASVWTDTTRNINDGATDPEEFLFAALADLCLAAQRTSYRADWVAAQAALLGSVTLDDCLSVAARRSLANALSNWQRTGRQRPDFRPTPRVSTCVPQPTYIGLYQRSAEESVALVVLGLRLFEASAVRIGGVWLDASSSNAVDGTECAMVQIPGITPPELGASLSVTIRGRGYTTAPFTSAVGPMPVGEDISNLDTTACLPAA